MDFDILTPEFFELAENAKKIYEKKEIAVQSFKEIWLKHKQEIAELDKQAEAVKQEYVKVLQGKKTPATEEEQSVKKAHR